MIVEGGHGWIDYQSDWSRETVFFIDAAPWVVVEKGTVHNFLADLRGHVIQLRDESCIGKGMEGRTYAILFLGRLLALLDIDGPGLGEVGGAVELLLEQGDRVVEER